MRGGGNSLLDLCDLDKTSAYKNPHYFYESHAVIVGFDNIESKKSAQSANTRPRRHYLSVAKYPNKINLRIAQQIKSFCYFLLSQKVESLYPLDSNLQSEIPQIRFWLIYFSHHFKSRALDTSLHCVSLSITNRPHAVILRAIARSIHFSDLKSKAIRGLYTNLNAIRRRFTRFAQIATMSSLRELQSNSWQSTFHTTHKGIKMNT